MLFSHLLAWIWGSINNGHRFVLSLMIAFSILKESLGRPERPQFRILTALPRTLSRLNLPELGMSFSWQRVTHCSERSYLYTIVNAPKYAIIPDEMSISPVKLTNTSFNLSDSAFHLVFSPPRPLISFSARMSFASQSATFASSSSLASLVSLRSFCSAFT